MKERVVILNTERVMFRGVAIAQWNRLRLPSCHRRFESQAHHLRFLWSNFVLYCHCVEKRTKNNKKRPALAHFLKKKKRKKEWYIIVLKETDNYVPSRVHGPSWLHKRFYLDLTAVERYLSGVKNNFLFRTPEFSIKKVILLGDKQKNVLQLKYLREKLQITKKLLGLHPLENVM